MKKFLVALGCSIAIIAGCENLEGPKLSNTSGNNVSLSLQIQPKTARIETGGQQKFYSTLKGLQDTTVTFTIHPALGSIGNDGTYTAPTTINGDSVLVKVIVQSVQQSTLKDTAVVTVVSSAAGQEVCFSRDILPIISSNCTMCHNQNPLPGKSEVIDFRTYTDVVQYVTAGNPEESKIYKVLLLDRSNGKAMPPGSIPLPSEQRELLRRWILQGAKNKDCSDGTSPCDTINIGYSKTLLPLLQKQCFGCHATAVAVQFGGGVNLEGYDNLRTQALNAKLVGAISHSQGFRQMPMGGNKLPDCTIAQVKAWVNKGAPND